MPFPTTSILDNFNRANEGPPPSASWVTILTGHQVISNTCAAAAGGDNFSAWNTSFAAAQESYCTISTLPPVDGFVGVMCRHQGNTGLSDHYRAEFTRSAGDANDSIFIYKYVGGVLTQLGATINLGVELVATDQIGIDANGTLITVYLNGVNKGDRTDSAITGAGYVGPTGIETTHRLDDFGGGAIVGTTRGMPFATRGTAFNGGRCLVGNIR